MLPPPPLKYMNLRMLMQVLLLLHALLLLLQAQRRDAAICCAALEAGGASDVLRHRCSLVTFMSQHSTLAVAPLSFWAAARLLLTSADARNNPSLPGWNPGQELMSSLNK